MTARAPGLRRVEHVTGMPISLAIRGSHADDDRGRTARAAAQAVLREADRVFSTYRPDSVISRLGRGELSLADYPPAVVADVTAVLAIGEAARRDSDGAFAVDRDGVGADGEQWLATRGHQAVLIVRAGATCRLW